MDNSYVYPTDPVNKLDLTGMIQIGMMIDGVAKSAKGMKAQKVASNKVHPLNGWAPVVNAGPTVGTPAYVVRECKSNCGAAKAGLQACYSGVCAGQSYTVRVDDGKHIAGVYVGSGIGAEVTGSFGISAHEAPGLSLQGSCSWTNVVGPYGEAGVGIDPGWLGTTFTPTGGVGGTTGFGWSCNGGLALSVILPF